MPATAAAALGAQVHLVYERRAGRRISWRHVVGLRGRTDRNPGAARRLPLKAREAANHEYLAPLHSRPPLASSPTSPSPPTDRRHSDIHGLPPSTGSTPRPSTTSRLRPHTLCRGAVMPTSARCRSLPPRPEGASGDIPSSSQQGSCGLTTGSGLFLASVAERIVRSGRRAAHRRRLRWPPSSRPEDGGRSASDLT